MTPIEFAREVFAELPERIRELPILGGGALRALFDGTEIKDYDLFFRNHDEYLITARALEEEGWEFLGFSGGSVGASEWQSPSGRMFNLVDFYWGTPLDHAERFDFRCCAMVAFIVGGEVSYFADVNAEDDATSRLLVLRWNNGDERTIKRIQHYVNDYGYTLVDAEVGAAEPGDTYVPIGTHETVLRELVRRVPRGTGGYN